MLFRSLLLSGVGISQFSFQVVVEKLAEGEYAKFYSNQALLSYELKEGEEPKEPKPSNPVTHETNTGKTEISKTASTILIDENDTEVIDQEGRGEASAPILTELKQLVEYKLTATRTADAENISGDLIITDIIPKDTSFVAESMTANITNAVAGSVATIKSMEYMTVTNKEGTETPAVKWVISGLSDGEKVEVTFRVNAPTTSDNPATSIYETEKAFINTANLFEKELSELIYEETFIAEDGTTHESGSNVYTSNEYDKDSETTYHVVKEPKVIIEKISNPASPEEAGVPVVKEGAIITYYITLTNEGAGVARNVSIRDYIPIGTTYVENSIDTDGILSNVTIDGEEKERIDWLIEEMQSEESVTVSFAVTVNPLLEEDGAILLRNIALYKVPNPLIPEEPEDPENPDAPFEPSNPVEHQVSSFIKYSNPVGGTTVENATFLKEGEGITYTLQLNTEKAGQAVIVKDSIPEGLLLVSGSISYTTSDGTTVSVEDSAYNIANRTITWPTINPEAGITKFEFRVVIGKLPEGVYAKYYSNKAIMEYKDLTKEPIETNEVTHKTNTGTTEIHKTASTILVDETGKETVDKVGAGSQGAEIDVEFGQIIEYKLEVVRRADSENRSGNLIVTDVIPQGTTFIEGSITAELVTTIQNSEAVIKSIIQKEVMDVDGIMKPGIEWVISGLADGEVVKLTFRVFAPMTSDNVTTSEYETSKIFTNTAKIQNDDGTKKQSETTYHKVNSPVLEAIKTSNPVTESIIKEGDILTYYIEVKNIGKGTAKNVIIKDTIPTYTQYIENSAISPKGGTFTKEIISGKESLIWIIEEIKPDESIIVSFQVKVEPMSEVGTRQIKNTAQIKLPAINEKAEKAAKDEEGYTDTNEVIHTQKKEEIVAPPSIPTPPTISQPKTGDNSNQEILFILLAVSMMAVSYIGKRRLKAKNTIDK